MNIRITKDHETEDGFLFWTGEVLNAGLTDDHLLEIGAEVKTAGEYVWIPSEVFEIIA